MSLSNKKKTQSTSDIFDDDFEVIYEGDLPDISIDDDDDYRDVLSGLSDIDHTDYIKKNDYDRLTKKLKNKNKKAGKKNKKQSKKDNFFDTAYYDDDIFDELDDDLYDDEYEDDYDNEYEDDCDDPRNNRQKEKKSRKNRGVKVPNVAKTAKAGGKILFKFINLLLRMGTLLLIAWIIYLLGLHFLANAGSFGNIVSRLTSADQELIAYLAVGAVLLLYEVIIFFCVLGGSKKQGRRGNSIDNGRGLTSFIIIAAGSYLSAMFAVLIPQAPAALLGIHNALTVYGGLKDTLLPICIAGVVSCIIRKFIIK